jgi:hypothetical protein
MPKILTRRGLLAVYSGCVTTALIVALLCGFNSKPENATFDSITVHRINVVEPNGTVRLILSDKAEFPGQYVHDKEVVRPDRRDSAGLMFYNDEGTEDGGLIYGGERDSNGQRSSFSHLSFDQYDQDQTVDLGGRLNDGSRSSGLAINDVPDYPITEQVIKDGIRFKSMPHGPDRAAAYAELNRKYPAGAPRAFFGRDSDGSVSVTLRAPIGHARAILKVKSNGEPVLDFLDQNGKVTREFSGAEGQRASHQ